MPKTSIKQKIILVAGGLFLSIVLLETGMRLAGGIFLFLQEQRNKVSFREKNEYRIMCLGESTTAFRAGDSWPDQLEELLNNKNVGIKFTVINKGVIGIDTAAVAAKIEKDLDKYNPDMVIAMLGVNDSLGTVLYKNNFQTKIVMLIKNLRVYKLAKFLGFSGDCEINPLKKRLDRDFYKENKKHIFCRGEDIAARVQKMRDLKKYEDAEKMLEKAIKNNPENEELYVILGECWLHSGKINELERMIYNALEINPKFEPAYTALGMYYRQENKIDKIYALAEKIAKEEINNDRLHGFVAISYLEQKKYEKAKRYFKKANKFRLKYYNPSTKYNYKKIKEIVISRGIKLVCMQYPMRDVESLKKLLDWPKDVIFVDNKKVFEMAVEYGKYEDYFMDNFGGDFGHCTFKGNRLLVENILNNILNGYLSKIF